jgi:hypothetical protein
MCNLPRLLLACFSTRGVLILGGQRLFAGVKISQNGRGDPRIPKHTEEEIRDGTSGRRE